ncbi:septum formation inhibitor Maf [Alginatibacterium sediminis]|uniref:7-methyl-GTP pyrophosphatase n=1 Tax=Alginatibacterium sediminis TaxID=2164068 RepID=A0A420EHK1_9ALTE|nr:Maf family protein [Alginatibacterium sediminis]RKF20137.1 septum formation inhibitor Maf [Alginatibacterium sediminis]
MTLPIILASTSVFRKQILDKLSLEFKCVDPACDESPLAGESADHLVERLAIAKAKAVAQQFDEHLIIGSDQVCEIDGQILGKPHTHENAVKQLQMASGKTVRFSTGLCLFNSKSQSIHSSVEYFDVCFRNLSKQIIEGYLHLEKPYKCAGSFKSEAAGIALFERLVGDDPNTLMGLPLIRLISFFEAENVRLFSNK